MTDSNRTRVGAPGVQAATRERAAQAFAIIANETRLSILLALWATYDPWATSNAMTFTELRRAVGYADAGNFNFHLEKLVGPFVRKTEEGYELRRAGLKLVAAVLAGVGSEEVTLPPTRIDETCNFCGAAVTVSYEDETVHIACTECEGFFGAAAGMPSGSLGAAELDPAGVADRTPGELFYVAMAAAEKKLQSSIEGVCSECSGATERQLEVCPDHDEAGVCEQCGNGLSAMGRLVCRVCKDKNSAPPRTLVNYHPAVVAFYWERGLAVQYGEEGWKRVRERKRRVHDHTQELVSTDPPLVAVTVRYAGDELRLLVDEDLEVVETTLVEGVGDGEGDGDAGPDGDADRAS